MKKIMYLLSIGLMVTLLGCGSSTPVATTPVETPQTKTETTDPGPTPENTNFAIGDTFNLGDLQYKINSVRISEGDSNQFMQPEEGNVFLLIDMTVENQGSEEAIVSSMLLFKLVDKDGRSQDFSISALAEAEGKMDATLAPGRKVTGELGYEVAKGPQAFELEITSGLVNGEMGFVEIPME